MRQAGFLGDSYTSKITPEKMLRLKTQKKNDAMRQAGILGDYIFPRQHRLNMRRFILLLLGLFGECVVQVRK